MDKYNWHFGAHFEVNDHGYDGSSYFPGVGVAFTDWDHAVVGVGRDFGEAIDDAIEMVAQGEDVPDGLIDALRSAACAMGRHAADPTESDIEAMGGDDSGWYRHVSIRWKNPSKDQQAVTVDVSIEPEDESIDGYAGSDESAAWVRDQLGQGNDWAWCSVRVVASCEGVESEPVYLGCCAYHAEDDFLCCGYFADMASEAIDNLRSKIERASKALSS